MQDCVFGALGSSIDEELVSVCFVVRLFDLSREIMATSFTSPTESRSGCEWQHSSACSCDHQLGAHRDRADCLQQCRNASDSSHDESSRQSTIPRVELPRKAKPANPRRVSPEPAPPQTIWNENVGSMALELLWKPSRYLKEEEPRTSDAWPRGRSDNTDIDGKAGLTGKRLSCEGSWQVVIQVPLKLWQSLRSFVCALLELPNLFGKCKGGAREKAPGQGLESLLGDLQENTTSLSKLPLQAPTHVHECRRSRGASGEGSLSALNFFTKDAGELQCTGYDWQSQKWQRLPTDACLPRPDYNLFKQFSLCGHQGLVCADVSNCPNKEELVVFNICTSDRTLLPPLHHPRNPTLLHIWVDSVSGSYKVIAAGSASSSGEKNLSRRVEIFDSLTGEWSLVGDLPGPEFGLNEHQTGVCLDGILYCHAFLEGDGRKGILALDIVNGKWLEDRTCEVSFSAFCNTLQLVASAGKCYLFSEQERDGVVEHCIDVVERSDADGERGSWRLRNVVRVTNFGGRGLLVFPEFTCVPFGYGKLCIFNTISRDGVVYDVETGLQSDELQAPPENLRGDNFYCLNPVAFTLNLNFANKS